MPGRRAARPQPPVRREQLSLARREGEERRRGRGPARSRDPGDSVRGGAVGPGAGFRARRRAEAAGARLRRSRLRRPEARPRAGWGGMSLLRECWGSAVALSSVSRAEFWLSPSGWKERVDSRKVDC